MDITTDNYTSNISTLINGANDLAKSAAKVGNALENLEGMTVDAYAADKLENITNKDLKKVIKDNKITTIEGLRRFLEIKYQSALTTFSTFQTMMRNKFDTLREALRNLRIG